MKTNIETPTYQEAEAVVSVPFQTAPFTISGMVEDVTPYFEAAQADFNARPIHEASKAQKAATAAVRASQRAYEDFSTLPKTQVLKMKVSAWLYDRQHDTNMLGLLVDRINDDRDVRYARELGLLSTVHCQRHEKALSELRRLDG